MQSKEEKTNKIFISYSWKPVSNKDKVLIIAERLTNDGIHVILDDWDLKEGQDKYHFMEQMVNDPEVQKVLLICNKEYAKKANQKIGGVGIESLIVSDDIYSEADQTKFIPVVMEYENEKPCIPTFVKSRIYIDLSNEDHYEENYERLIRNIYNKPISKRPPIGKMPVHLEEDDPIFLPTAHKVAAIKNSLINQKENSTLLIKDYLNTFIESLSIFEINFENIDEENFINEVEKSILELQALKNDFIEFTITIFKYSNEDYEEIFIEFFESFLQFYEDNDLRLDSGKSLNDLRVDNFRFFNYDLFLNFSNSLIKNQRFKLLAAIVKTDLIVTRKWNRKAEATNFEEFRKYNYTLNEFKKQKLNSNRISLVADLIKQHCKTPKFEDLIRTDIILYYLRLFYPSKIRYNESWVPETSALASSQIEIFPKIISKRYFNKIKVLFDIDSVEELKEKILSLEDKDDIKSYNYRVPRLHYALKYDELAIYN